VTDQSRLVLEDACRQCERHLHHLKHALASLSALLPVNRPMLDKLHRLEKLGYLPNVESWNTLRSIRNHFAHDYPQDDALKAAYLNEAVSAVPQMEALLAKITPLMNAN